MLSRTEWSNKMYDVDRIEQEILNDMSQENDELGNEDNLDLQDHDEDAEISDEETFDEGQEETEEEVGNEDEDEADIVDEEHQDIEETEEEVDTPQHRAFAEMRVENKRLAERVEQMDMLLEIVREGSGFESQEQLIQALMGAKPEIDKRRMGLDDEGYQKHLQLEQERAIIEQEKQTIFQEKLDTRANRFQSVVDNMTRELGIEQEVVFRNLANSGYTDMAEILMGTQDYERLLKSVLIDEIVEHKANKIADKELSRKSVETDKISNTRNASSTFEEQQDRLLDKDIEEFMKNQGY